ncbi:MAG: prolipoprotein diacylglyceryl transferase [Bacilli bacterium]|nr:prolipoprotein diacylglyceryl transferase [Bacilli bacterium]
MNPVAFTIGVFEIRWYSIFILAAVIFGYITINREAKRFGIRGDFVFNMMFWSFIVGLICARLYYVIFNLDLFKSDPLSIVKLWEGGLAIHGGLLGGLVTIILYCKKYKVKTIRILDFVAPAMLLSQAIGRWGNFFNQEAHGAAIDPDTLRRIFIPDFIINGMTIDGVTYTPSFLFESIICLVMFILIAFIRRGKYVKIGQPLGLYLLAYGGIRFFIEMGRTDSLMLGGFKMAQIISVIFFISGLCIMAYTSRKSKFEDLYNDASNIDEIRF